MFEKLKNLVKYIKKEKKNAELQQTSMRLISFQYISLL